jgi:DNA (cytosine-5)-methyltransferase 1
VCAVEIEEYPRKVLMQRQDDGILPPFPIWDDVCTFDGGPWRGIVDVVSGGFPCQDISAAGKGAGIEGERSGLWGEMARIIREVGPRFVFVENSPLLVGRGLAVVIGDLAEMGYDARWGIVGAHHAGAPHKRDRCWIVANADETGLQGFAGDGADGDEPGRDRTQEGRSFTEAGLCGGAEDAADSDSINGRPGTGREDGAEIGDSSTPVGNTNQNGCNKGRESLIATWSHGFIGADWWKSEPELGRVADGVAGRVDRLKAIGNGQVPAVAALAWDLFSA